MDPDLGKFFARGGKLLLVDGWSDTRGAAQGRDQLLQRGRRKARREDGEGIDAILHGAGHGPRPWHRLAPKNFNFDALGLIEQWKENGKAPDQLIVSHFKDGMEIGKRLVCQYPQIAHV